MELIYDWKNFQAMFYPKRRAQLAESAGPVYLVVENKRILTAFAEAEDLSQWIGSTTDEVASELGHRELVIFDREKVDQWMGSAMGLPHFHDQVESLRSEATPQVLSRSRFKKDLRSNADQLIKRHFLLEAIQTWWSKALPSAFGVYIRLDGPAGKDLFLIVRRGRLDSFHEPDLSSMIVDRRKNPADVVRYLSERHVLPVQGISITSQEWMEWGESRNPWPKVAAAIKSDRSKLVPFNWGLASLVASRAYLGL